MKLIDPESKEFNEYIQWLAQQPEKFTSQSWFEGYGEGRRQQMDNTIEFPDILAPKPSVDNLIKSMEEEQDE